jgi:hypothetical protein
MILSHNEQFFSRFSCTSFLALVNQVGLGLPGGKNLRVSDEPFPLAGFAHNGLRPQGSLCRAKAKPWLLFKLFLVSFNQTD